ncbi:putative FORKHEAD [Lyophyllum shimeji]|uniref:FORKHEAD n=1 Tax=Lyophyllum shimeji TaxID=47721 RepID=A0A9P3UU36_LYOSH|nr:putative FORKHEAD [Lyophyllum shimeji]
MAISVDEMSRPNRQGYVPHSHPHNAFDNSRANAQSYESQASGRGGPHGHGDRGHGVSDTFNGYYVDASGSPFPPQRENPQSQRRAERSSHGSSYNVQNQYDFSSLQVSNVSNYQTDPGFPGTGQGSQPTRPQDYYRGRHAGEQWSSPDSGYQTYQQSAQAYPMNQEVLPPGVDPSMSRRGLRAMPQSHGQPSQYSPSNFYGYQPSTSPTTFWPGPDSQAPYNSPSPSSSSDGSPNIHSDSARATLSLSPSEIRSWPPVEVYLRQELNIPPDQPVSLWSLPTPPPGTRPNLTYKLLASLAIFGSRQQKLSLQEIYEAIEERFDWYKNQSDEDKKKWQGSLRHNLSLECIFLHSGRPVAEPGKGGYWMLTNKDGYGQKRLRKRRGRPKGMGIKGEEEDQLLGEGEDSFTFASADESQIASSSGVHRTARQSRSSYRSSPQPMHSFTDVPAASERPVFGQSSFPPPPSGPMRNLGQPPMRMQSMPAMAAQSSASTRWTWTMTRRGCESPAGGWKDVAVMSRMSVQFVSCKMT